MAPTLGERSLSIVQEALTNACKYSKSKKYAGGIGAAWRGRLQFRYWGIGFDPKEVKEDRFGLAGMRELKRDSLGATSA